MPRPRKMPARTARTSSRFLKDPRTKYRQEFIPVIKSMVRKGSTDFEIASSFGISVSTLGNWKTRDPKLGRAMKRAEDAVVEQTEASMWQRANGYSHDDEEITSYQGRIIRTKTIKVYPPSEAAAKLMLGAARPEKYRERVDIAGDASRPVRFVLENLNLPAEEAKEASNAEAARPA